MRGDMENSYIIVFSTAPNADEAASIGRKIVEERLAACCNIIPGLRSIYTWKGRLCDEGEALMIFKTRGMLFEGLKKRIKDLHSYELPEVIAVNIEAGLPEYLSWIHEMTGADGR